MFSNRIANSAKFLQMPEGAQLLYFHMVLRADDDGVVEAYPVMRLLGTQPDNFKVLLAKQYIKQLNDDQVVIISDWIEHNSIRADRKVNSIYVELIKEYAPEVTIIEPKPRVDVADNSKRIGGQSTDGLGKDRLGQVRIGNVKKTIATPKVVAPLEQTKEEFIQGCKENKRKDIQLIGEWAEANGVSFSKRSQWGIYLRRNLRAARELSTFDEEDIQKAFSLVEEDKKNGLKYTPALETLLKKLTK